MFTMMRVRFYGGSRRVTFWLCESYSLLVFVFAFACLGAQPVCYDIRGGVLEQPICFSRLCGLCIFYAQPGVSS